jgi:hypothetical protein
MTTHIRFTEQDLVAIDNALAQLETLFAKLVALEPRQRQRLFKMGSKSETFCRETLAVMDKNRALVPPVMDLNGALASLTTIDALRPRARQILRLAERMQDTALLLGSDVATAARQGYRALQQYGDAHGLEGMRQTLSARFKRRGTRKSADEVKKDKQEDTEDTAA